jgi:N-acetylmuramoyl-L-alanine amidase
VSGPDSLPPGAAPSGPALGEVRDLTPEEYAATYADGQPHHIPDDVLARVEQSIPVPLERRAAPAALRWMPADSYGGKLTASVVVIHCTESDNNAGTAESLAGPNWFGPGGPATTSAHKMFDRDSGVEMVKRTVVAYHAGPKGNTVGISYEFCGKAGWSAAKWREAPQLDMLRRAAPHIADDLRAIGAPARWLTLTQLAAGQRGLCTHNDVRLALGGTTHSDPGPNFPYAELLTYVQAATTGGDDLDMDNATLKRLVWEVLMQEDVQTAIARRVITAELDSPNDKRGKWPLLARIPAMDVQLNAVAAAVEKIRGKVGA